MIKIDNILPTIQGATGFTLLQVMPHSFDVGKLASTVVVLITAIVQIITLFKKKKSIHEQQ